MHDLSNYQTITFDPTQGPGRMFGFVDFHSRLDSDFGFGPQFEAHLTKAGYHKATNNNNPTPTPTTNTLKHDLSDYQTITFDATQPTGSMFRFVDHQSRLDSNFGFGTQFEAHLTKAGYHKATNNPTPTPTPSKQHWATLNDLDDGSKTLLIVLAIAALISIALNAKLIHQPPHTTHHP